MTDLTAMFRLELLTGKNQTASDRLSQSEERRQDIETQFETTGEKIDQLERQVAAAKEIAEESDKKVEEVVRKLMLAELQRDRAEMKAERNDSKIISKNNIIAQWRYAESDLLLRSGEGTGKYNKEYELSVQIWGPVRRAGRSNC